MALEVRWYDFICLAIVIGSIVVAFWVIWTHDCHSGRDERDDDERSKCESLLLMNGTSSYYGSNNTLLGLVPYCSSSSMGYVDSTMLWMSCWKVVHPAWLLAFRLVATVVMGGVLFWDVRTYNTSSIMLYYTEWTFLLVIIYFAIATFISAHGCWIYSKQQTNRNEEASAFLKVDMEQSSHAALIPRMNKYGRTVRPLCNDGTTVDEKRAGSLGHLMQIIYQTCAGAVMLTDVVFWCLIEPFMSSAHFSLNAIMGCMHTLNLLFLLIDTALNSLPFPWFRLAYFVLWTSTYVIFQWILHACGFSWWPYPFLELSSPWAPFWYFGMALLHIPCYGLYWLIVRAKNTYFPKLFPHWFIRSNTF